MTGMYGAGLTAPKGEPKKFPRINLPAPRSAGVPGLFMRSIFPAETDVLRNGRRFNRARALRICACVLLVSVCGMRAADVLPRSPIAREAMLLLKGECFSCHNEKKKKGGLILTSRDALLKGSD